MKKLIAMIGAVAMSFGLFADPAVPKLNTSFETDDAGVVDNTTFTPGVGSGWAGIDSVLLGKYGPGEAYAGYGAKGSTTERRAFVDNPAQDNYLPLKTDGVEVTRDVNDIFLDQLVKFTGFEDAPEISTTDKTKIALWMSGVEADEGIEGETNLYATVAKVNADKSKELVTLKLVEPNGAAWETEKWYRLTIKKIGDIYGGKGTSDAARAGFIVYVDGVQVAAAEAEDDTDVDPKTLIPDEFKSEMDPLAKSYMSKGMLFPAYDTTDTAFNTVSYKGIGAIDDIYIDADGPAFAQITYRTFEVTPIDGLTIGSVVSEDGGDPLSVPYTVQDGKKVTVTWAIDPTYKVMSGSLTQEVTIDADNINITPTDDDIVVAEIFATKVNGGVKVDDYAESQLYGMITTLVNGDVVTFAKAAIITNIVEGETETYYDVPVDTEIAVAVENDVTTWAITVPGDWISFTDYIGVDASLVKNFTFTGEGSSLAVDEITVAGTLRAAAIDSSVGSITLSGAGKVETQVEDLENDFINADDAEVEAVPGEEGWITYQIKQGFTVEVPEANDNTKLVVTIDDVLAGMTNGIYTVAKASTLKAVYTADTGYTLDGKGDWAVDYETKDTVIEAPTATADEYTITIAEGGEGASATPATYTIESFKGENLEVTLDAGTAPTDKQFKAWTKNVDDTVATIDGDKLTILNGQLADITVTATWEDIAYVAQVNNEKFLTTAAALAKVWELEAVPTFPITVTCLAADGFTVKYGDPEQSVTLAQNETIVITADSWKFDAFSGNVVLAPGKTIMAKSEADGAKITTIPGYKVVKSAEADEQGYFTYSVVEMVYVAQIVGGQSFETFEEAVAALTADGQTIKLLDDTALKAGVTPAYDVTFDLGDCTLDAKLEYSITISAGKTLNLTNGTIDVSTKSYSVEVYGTLNVLDGAILTKDGSTGPVLDIYNGSTVNVYAGATLNAPAQQVFRFKNANNTATINIYGGTIVGNSSAIIDCYKDKSVANVTISGGTFTGTGELVKCGSGTGSYEGQTVTVNLAISGGDFTIGQLYTIGEGSTLNVDPLFTSANCAAKFSTDEGVNDCCADGYKAFKAEGSDWYTIVATQLYTANLYVDGTAAGTIELGTGGQKFAKGEKVVATKPGVIDDTVEPDFAKGKTYYVEKLVLFGETEKVCEFEYDGTTLTKKGTDEIGVDLANNILTYTVETGDLNPFGAVYVKEYVAPSPTPDPVDPEKPIDVPADDINKNIGAYLKVPAAVADTNAYLTLFHAVDKGDGTAEIVLTDAATNTLTQAVAAETKAIPVSEIAAGTATEIAVTGATPGLWYQLNAAATLDGMAPVDEAQCPASGAVNFTKGVAGQTADTARFFKISVSATQRITNKGE